MLTRRTLLSLSAATPLVHMKSMLDVEDTQLPALDTGDVTVMGMSPDASLLVGTRNQETICFLDSKSLEVISETPPTPVISSIDPKSIRWNPDSTRIAFSLNTWLYAVDSDIYIVDVESGEITNSTGEGHENEADSILSEAEIVIDLYPVWTGDNELLFARHERVETDGPFSVSIQSITPGSGEPTMVADLEPADIKYILSPIELLPDGSMIFTSQSDDLRRSEITKLMAPDEITTISAGDLQYKLQLSVNETSSLVVTPQDYGLWILPHDDSGDIVTFEEAIGYEDKTFIGEPATAPNPTTYAGVINQSGSDKFRVLTNIDGDRRDRGYLEGGISGGCSCHLAGGRLLITTRDRSWLIALDS